MPIKLVYDNRKFNGWNLIHQTYDSIMQCQEKACSAYGLTAKQQAMLVAIKELPKPVTIKELADCFDRDSASITFIIDRMEKDGLVVRIRDLKDRRSLRICITPKGKIMLNKSAKAISDLADKTISVLSKEELESLTSLMEKIQKKTYEYRNILNIIKVIKLKYP